MLSNAIIIGGDNHAPLHLLGLLLGGLFERGWIEGSEIEACRAEYQSFVQEQRQLERSSTRSRPDVGDVLSLCPSQAGFRARQHLLKAFIMTGMVKRFDQFSRKKVILFFQVFQLTALIIRGPVTSGERLIISVERVMICEGEVRGALFCVEDFVRSPHFTQRTIFSDSGSAMLAESAAICDSITSSAVFETWSNVETASGSQVVVEVCACVKQAVDRRRAVEDSQEQWYAVGGIEPSSDDSASRSGVRISKIVGEGRVEYVPISVLSIGCPAPAIYAFPRESSRRGILVEALSKDASKLQVPLSRLNNIF